MDAANRGAIGFGVFSLIVIASVFFALAHRRATFDRQIAACEEAGGVLIESLSGKRYCIRRDAVISSPAMPAGPG